MSEATLQKNNKKKIASQDARIDKLKNILVYYKEISESIRDPFVILDKNLHVVTANLAFYRKFKVNKKATEGKQIYMLGNNQWDIPQLRKLLEHILPKHRVLSKYEVTHDFPGLGPKTMLLNARQVDGKQLILLAIEDITATRKLKTDTDEMTANLVKQRDQLKGLNDAKDEFISLASHQLRTPATAVKQYTSMLIEGYEGDVSRGQMGMLKVVYKSNERQLEIIEDLLRVAKVDAGKVYLIKSSCDIGRQVHKAIRGQAILFKNRGQAVVFVKPTQPVIAYIDPKLMLMVVENILDNAGKYSKDGEQITVTIHQDKHYTTVSVQDVGVGIRQVDLRKLFKKFSRIDNPLSISVSGTGLGLYWAKKVLDLHDGSIEVTSRPNQGSTFTIKIPTPSHA